MMMHRLSCAMLNRRASSGIAKAAAGFAALAVFCVFAAWFLHPNHALAADTAPDWLRAAAQDKLPDYPKDADAVMLLNEQFTTVKDNGEIETRYRGAYKLLRPESRDSHGGVAVNFDNETKLTYFKAWTITLSGGAIEVKEKEAAEVGLYSYEIYSDQKVKYLKFPEANPGSVVGYEYVQKHRPFVFEDDWWFQSRVPTRKARFTLQLPTGWDYATFWAHYLEQKPATSGANQFVWEMQDVPGIEIEKEMPPWLAVAGRMDVKYFPRDPNMRARTTGSWKDLGLWYSSLTASSRAPSPQMQQKVAELTAGKPDRLEKMKVLAEFVQRQVRYVAIEIGIGGFRPHNASDVFMHQYGDCKDKATLMSAMLHEIGIESYYVLVDTERGIVSPAFPSVRFNHAIVAIKIPDDVPTSSLYAMVNHPQLGKLLFFDPTSEYTPLGYLPSSLQDNYGLVVTPAGGELLAMPLLPASTNRLLRTGTLSLSEAGNLDGTVLETRWGAPAEMRRAQLMGIEPKLRAKVFEEFLGATLNTFTLTHASIGNLDQFDQTLTLNYSFVSSGYAKTAGDLLIVQPRVVGRPGSNILAGKPRKYPIEFREASRQDDVFDITLPKGYVVDELPKPVKAECAYGSYKSEMRVEGNVLHYQRMYEITDVIVPTQKLDEVKDFFHQIAADEHASAILRRATP
jgi:transglutaminase-like putative cysteine protease